MSDLPEPMVPADCDLTDFAFMPLDVARLRDSDLAANETPEACWAAVLLWSAAWHQVPAGSMPDNDAWIAKQAGYALRGRIDPAWKKVRAGAMHGWVLCSDGRYHHPVVAEKARDAWDSKLMQRWRTECGRIKKHNDRHKTDVRRPTYEEWISSGRPAGHPLPIPEDDSPCPQGQSGAVPGDKPPDDGGHPPPVPDEIHSKRKREGQGQGQGHLNTYSVPDGTAGGDAPPASLPPAKPAKSSKPPKEKTPEEMAKAELWRAAVSVLGQGGCPEAQARSFMGKLVQDYTFPVVQQAVAAAVSEQPADAREYLKAACQHAAGERQSKRSGASAQGKHTGFTEDYYANAGGFDD